MSTISWDTFTSGLSNLTNGYNEELTNIRCPECNEVLYKIINQVYTTYPPKHKYICKNCGWNGYA